MSVATERETHFVRERAQSLASYRSVLDARDKELVVARTSMGPGSERWKALAIELQSARGICQDIFAALLRLTDGKRIPQWLVMIFALAFAAMEAPINKFMMDNILRGNNFDSYVLSLFLTLIMLLLAHVAGMQARQVRGAYEDKIYWGKIAAAIILLGVLAICVGALTIGRAFYSTSAGALPTSNIFAEIQVRVLNAGPWSAFISALSDQAAFFLASLNLAGITGAFILAFVSHDSDMVYQSALDRREKSERKLGRMAKKYDRRVRNVGRKYNKRLENLAAAYGAQNAEVIALREARGTPLSAEDHVDLGSLDTLLREVRQELEQNAPTASRDGELTQREQRPVAPSQVLSIDRR